MIKELVILSLLIVMCGAKSVSKDNVSYMWFFILALLFYDQIFRKCSKETNWFLIYRVVSKREKTDRRVTENIQEKETSLKRRKEKVWESTGIKRKCMSKRAKYPSLRKEKERIGKNNGGNKWKEKGTERN